MLPGSSYSSNPTPRQIEVLKLVAAGLSTKQIAASLGISFKTAACHRSHLMQKLGIHEVAGLTRYAIRKGFLEGSGKDSTGASHDDLFDRVRLTYAEYKRALDAYSAFLKERQSFGFASPDGVTGTRRFRDGERDAHEKYHAALLELKMFLSSDSEPRA